jgi:peptidoglycan/xylan/chitin deacetylase (PgdA/CDA1 family)
MRFVSPLLKRLVYPSLAKAGVFRRSGANGLSIVTYHGVLPEGYQVIDAALDGSLVTASTLRQQLRLLRTNYNLISPELVMCWCMGKAALPSRAVLITCDDGLANVVSDMLPVLQEEKIQCLFFVIGLSAEDEPRMLWYEELFLMLMAAGEKPFSIRLDDAQIEGVLGNRSHRRTLWRDITQVLEKCDHENCSRFLRQICSALELEDDFAATFLRDPVAEKRFRLLRPYELSRLVSAGMLIGAHTLSHPALSKLPEERARFEITEGRSRLEKALGREVWAFAYPFGGVEAVSSREFRMAERAGYKAAFLSFGGGLGADLPRYALPRIHMTGEITLSELEAYVSGFHRSLRRQFGREQQILSAA